MTSGLHDERADSFAHSTVPTDATGSAAKIFFVVAGSCCGLPVFVLSSSLSTGLGFRTGLAAFFLGAMVAGALGSASALSGARSRMTLAQLADITFGIRGAQLVQLAIALALFGWYGVGVSVLGATVASGISQVFSVSVPTAAVSLPLCVLVTLIALRGIEGLERLGIVLVPLTFLLLIIAAVMTRDTFTMAARSVGVGGITFGSGVSAVVGAYIVGIIIQPDYGRFVRSPAWAALAVFTALGISYPLILSLSAIPALALGKPDLITALMFLGIGLPALALLVMGAWIDSSMSLYSGGLSIAKLIPSLHFNSIIIGGGAAGLALALGHVERHFIPFLQLLSVALPPVAAVQCVAALWPESPRLRARPLPAIRFSSLSAWAIGVAVSVLSERLGLPGSGISAVYSILGGGLSAIGFRLVSIARSRRGVDEPGV